MSRPIKFRVWYLNENRYLETPDGLFFRYPSSTGHGEYIGDFVRDTDVYVTEQFTGRKDLNGVEIYEGDIVERIHSHLVDDTGFSDERAESIEARGVIAYSDLECQFQLQYKKAEGIAKHNFSLWYYSRAGVKHYRVLGNVHQNSELIA